MVESEQSWKFYREKPNRIENKIDKTFSKRYTGDVEKFM